MKPWAWKAATNLPTWRESRAGPFPAVNIPFLKASALFRCNRSDPLGALRGPENGATAGDVRGTGSVFDSFISDSQPNPFIGSTVASLEATVHGAMPARRVVLPVGAKDGPVQHRGPVRCLPKDGLDRAQSAPSRRPGLHNVRLALLRALWLACRGGFNYSRFGGHKDSGQGREICCFRLRLLGERTSPGRAPCRSVS